MTENPVAALPQDRPLVTVDLVILTVRQASLEVLLVRRPERYGEPFPGVWALPGGFVDVARDADLEACARRKLADKTGLRSPYLEQLGAFGSRERDPRGWSVTQVYFALVPAAAMEGGDAEGGGHEAGEGCDVGRRAAGGASAAGTEASDAAAAPAPESRWWPVTGNAVRTKLAFDHAKLLAAALERLRSKVEYTSLPAFLLPAEFTFPELQRAYEVVLGRAVEKSAFRRRMLAAELVEPLEKWRETGKRPAQLYRLAKKSTAVVFPRTFSPRE